MKFHFPIIIIDEDWKSESSSGLGIRALAKAIEDQGMQVVGGFTYVDVTMVANQAARASAFVVSIDDEEIGEDGAVQVRDLDGGRYAVLSLAKDATATDDAIDRFYADYAPAHGLLPDETRPSIEVYHRATIDYCVPVR